jgi:hypothetical protein
VVTGGSKEMVKLLALVAINIGWFSTAAASWLLVY